MIARSRRLGDTSGFTIAESMVALGLAAGLAYALLSGSVGTLQIASRAKSLNGYASARTEVLSALADSSTCTQVIRAPGGGVFSVPTAEISLPTGSLSASSARSSGSVYPITLYRPSSQWMTVQMVDGTTLSPDSAQIFDSNRHDLDPGNYSVTLKLSGGNRKLAPMPTTASTALHPGVDKLVGFIAHIQVTLSKNKVGPQMSGSEQLVANLPVYVQFAHKPGPSGSFSTLSFCSIRPEEIPQTLSQAGASDPPRGGEDCVFSGGIPYPTRVGVLCRFPITAPVDLNYNYITKSNYCGAGCGASPHCAACSYPSCPSGWTAVQGENHVLFTSSRLADHVTNSCSGSSKCISLWHPFSATFPQLEACTTSLKNKKNRTSYAWTSAGVGFAITGDPLLAGVILLFSSDSDCKQHKEPWSSQPMAIGCL